MEDSKIASTLKALGHEARLKIFRMLVRAGDEGLNIGDIGNLVGLHASTLAHHLHELVRVGLVIQNRQGREVISRVDFDLIDNVMAFVTYECCKGVSVVKDAPK